MKTKNIIVTIWMKTKDKLDSGHLDENQKQIQ